MAVESAKRQSDIATKQKVVLNIPYDRFLDCVHCGLCMGYCPTYAVNGMEADSPRGRIHLMRAVADGRLEFEQGVKEHIDLCLGCLACETACPSGVHYREILEAGREMSRKSSRRTVSQRVMESTLYDPAALERAIAPLRWAGRMGLASAARKAASKLPAGLGEMLELMPELPPASLRRQFPELVDAVGPTRARVGMLTGCVMSVFFSPTNLATVKVLASNGCEVHIPKEQGCCGALAAHAGDSHTGAELARRLIDVFLPLNLDAIVVNSAGCGSAMKDYGHALRDDPEYASKAILFASLVKDASEFLAALPIRFPDEGPLRSIRVTYHDACHLAHGQGVRSQPRSLLEKMPGVELVELKEADWCCGSAGTYNLTQPEMAERLQERKCAHIEATGAEVVVSGNPGCLLQVANGLRKSGSSVRAVHTMDLLAMAYPDPVPGLPTDPRGPLLGPAEVDAAELNVKVTS
jgi:glycolate oxidase iron-sulfur subunit